MTASELKKFQSFVSSPYFNKNPKLNDLLDYISQHYPHFEGGQFTEENAYAHLHPGISYKTGVITKLSSKLFKLLVRFFSVEELGANKFNLDYHLLVEYRKRGLLPDFDLLARNMHKYLKRRHPPEPELFHQRFLLEREINRVESTRKDKGMGDVNFSAAAAALDSYYIYHKLIYTCQKINRGNIVKGFEYEDPLIHTLQTMSPVGYGKEPIIQIWHNAYLLLTQPNELGHYKNLKDNILCNSEMAGGAQLRILFTYLENAAIRMIHSRKALYAELFELYEYQRKIGVFLHQDVAVSDVMSNYITVAINLGKTHQARAFLDMARPQLGSKRSEMYKFCDAMVLFEEGEYETALDRLNELRLHNILMKLGEKRLRLKVYLSLDYEELLYDNINSFRVFLTNNKDHISDRHLEANRRFVTYLKRIIQARLHSHSEREAFRLEIQSDQIVTDKSWLLRFF